MAGRQNGPTLIFAHRGANREAAENSRNAFDRALRHAVDGIETDVQLSRDGVPVLWHDRFLDRLGLPGQHIDEFDYADLERLDFAGRLAPGAPPEGVLGLGEFLSTYRNRCRLLIEVKNRDWEEKSRHRTKMQSCLALVGTCPGKAADPSILISSFNLESLLFAHNLAPDFPLVHNLDVDQTEEDAIRILNAHPYLHGLCVPIEILDEAMVQLLHDRGTRLAVYTCNSEAEIKKAFRLGVDILITDDPAEAQRLKP